MLSGNATQGGASFRSSSIPNGGAFGGGILNVATLTILNSTFSGNSAQGFGYQGLAGSFAGYADGGGIYNTGTLTVHDSTFSGNSAQGVGGGTTTGSFAGDASAGGIYNAGVLTILGSTLSGNSASFVAVGTAVGGGIQNDTTKRGMISVRNTIVAGNSAASSSDINGPVNSLGYNLIGVDAGGSAYADTDLVGTSASPLDPKLGPLQDNGGPTETMALLPGSPAINAGGLTDSEWDQRGPSYPRTVHGATDIGAYEVQASGSRGTASSALFPDAILLGRSAVSSEVLTPTASRGSTKAPGEPSHQAVAAVDALFVLHRKEETGSMLFTPWCETSVGPEAWASGRMHVFEGVI
jgi:hypothetical protein